MKKPFIAAFAIAFAATAALARTVSLDSIEGTSARVTVGSGDGSCYLRIAYGKSDGGVKSLAGWDSYSRSLAEIPAAGATVTVQVPSEALYRPDIALCARFVVTEHPYDAHLAYLRGNGLTWFDTGITNNSSDTIFFDFTWLSPHQVENVGNKYGWLYGCRDSAFLKNISLTSDGGGPICTDFTSTSMTSGNVPGRVPGIDPSEFVVPFHIAITNSAAERWCRYEDANISREYRNTDETFESPFECSHSARIFSIAGNPTDLGEICSTNILFHGCRIVRNGETIADMIPVVVYDELGRGAGAGRIYDCVRKKILERGGTISQFSVETEGSVLPSVVAASAAIGSQCPIVLHSLQRGRVRFSVAKGFPGRKVVLACDAGDEGTSPDNYDNLVEIATLSGDEETFNVQLPSGWGGAIGCFRLFLMDSDFEPYLDSSGTQYIDTCWTNGYENVVEMVFVPLSPSEFSSAKPLYGCRNGASSRNILMFGDSQGIAMDFNNENYSPYRLGQFTVVGYRYRLLNSAAKRIAERSRAGVLDAAKTNATPWTASFTCAGSAYLFAGNDMSSGSPALLWPANGLPSLRFHSLKVWNAGGKSCCDMRPCKIGGVGQVYDAVRERYFTNSGTGDFTFGHHGSSDAVALSIPVTPQTNIGGGFMVIVH